MNIKLQRLFDKSLPFDSEKVNTLNQITQYLKSNDILKIDLANKVWKQIKDDKEFWLYLFDIYNLSSNNLTKLMSLSILQQTVKLKWIILHIDQKIELIQYLFDEIKQMCCLELQTYHFQLLTKLNFILVCIFKYEYNGLCSGFIEQLCCLAETNRLLLQNAVKIIRLMSQQVFHNKRCQIYTHKEIKEAQQIMKENWNKIFYRIFSKIIQSYEDLPLGFLREYLLCIKYIVCWIPIRHLLFSKIFIVVNKCIKSQKLKLYSINCLKQLSEIQIVEEQQQCEKNRQKFIEIIGDAIKQIQNYQKQLKKHKTNRQCKQQLVMFYTNNLFFIDSLLVHHSQWISVTCPKLFYTILDYIKSNLSFHKFQIIKLQIDIIDIIIHTFKGPQLIDIMLHLKQFIEFLVIKIKKPIQIVIIFNQDKRMIEIQQDITNDEINQDKIMMYEKIQKIINKILRIKFSGLKQFFICQLSKFKQSPWLDRNDYIILNNLSWCLGAIKESKQDKLTQFYNEIIKLILNIYEMISKNNHIQMSIITSLMYIFSKKHYYFAKALNQFQDIIQKVIKLFTSSHYKILNFASNIFLQFCTYNSHLFQLPKNSNDTLIDKIYQLVPMQILQCGQIYKIKIYKGLAVILSKCSQNKLFKYYNYIFGQKYNSIQKILQKVNQNPNNLKQNCSQILFFFKLSKIFLENAFFLQYIQLIKDKMIEIYEICTAIILNIINQQGIKAINLIYNKQLRLIKQEIISIQILIIKNILKIQKSNDNYHNIISDCDYFLQDFITMIIQLKQVTILQLYSNVIQEFSLLIPVQKVQFILKYLFSNSIKYLKNDITSQIQLRQSFFKLLSSFIKKYSHIDKLPIQTIISILDLIAWIYKNDQLLLTKYGLDILQLFLVRLNSNRTYADLFYPKFYTLILKDMLDIFTDGYHKSDYNKHIEILHILLYTSIRQSTLTVKLDQFQMISNRQYVFNIIFIYMKTKYLKCNQSIIFELLSKLFLEANKFQLFKHNLTDILILLNRSEAFHYMIN